MCQDCGARITVLLASVLFLGDVGGGNEAAEQSGNPQFVYYGLQAISSKPYLPQTSRAFLTNHLVYRLSGTLDLILQWKPTHVPFRISTVSIGRFIYRYNALA